MACITPYMKKADSVDSYVPLVCGKCPPCLKRRVDEWVFRLMEEEKVSTHAHFVTLTYAPHSVPLSRNNFMTLHQPDFTNFMKRLRKISYGKKLKYYACGEYGSSNKRPHYHAIIFNNPDKLHYRDAWSLIDRKTGKPNQIGQIHVGDLTNDSAAYCLKYMEKREYIRKFSRDDRKKEFSTQSQHLGLSYLSPQIIRYHRSRPFELYIVTKGGKKIAMPKYYREKIWNEQERQQQLRVIKDTLDKKKEEQLQEQILQGLNPKQEEKNYKEGVIANFKSITSKNRKL